MPHFSIISSSIRTGRRSHRVSLFFKDYLEKHQLASVELIDLDNYNFPLFKERLSYEKNPLEEARNAAQSVVNSDAIIIVTPEYNGGYPAALKNFIDFLYDEWYHKPVGIATVSKGVFGGAQVITSLQFVLWKMHALVVPVMFPVPEVQNAFNENGEPADPVKTNKRAEKFVNELLWMSEAVRRMSDETV